MNDRIKVAMWSNYYGSNPDVFSDVSFIVTELNGYIVYNDDVFCISKEPFTFAEANDALNKFWDTLDQNNGIEFIPVTDWKCNRLKYKVVQDVDREPVELIVENLNEADIDWTSMEEHGKAVSLDLGQSYTSPDGYLSITRIAE
jgi:hypothetical protein